MKYRKLYLLLLPLMALFMGGCNEFLDVLPDNRAEINTVEKVQKLLVSAYSSRCYVRMNEIASDNCDDMGEKNVNGGRLLEQNSYWEHMTEADNESNVNTWQNYYQAISVANTALQAIEEMGNTPELQPYKGEALICRAYAHFCLTMLYCLPYHPEKAGEYLGIPYMDQPEKTLNPFYVRESLKSVYEKIQRDLEEGLPLINDEAYEVPKYHFNRQAAHAFAARFYLYSMQWEKVIEHANSVLGQEPELMMRDWEATNKLIWDSNVRMRDYVDPSHRFNLLMIPLYSSNGTLFHAWSASGARYTHNNRTSKMETFRSKRPMGGTFDRWKSDSTDKIFDHAPFRWDDNITNKVWMPKWPNQWEVANVVTGSGYARSTFVAFTANEVLMNRAEAYIHLKDYEAAINDLNVWVDSFYKVGQEGIEFLTRERINEVYGDSESDLYIAEYTAELPTSRKPIHPHGFVVEPGEQEYMIQTLLYCRRIETLSDGLRWMDIKRYGITIDRFYNQNYIDDTTTGYEVSATLPYKDLRHAFQLPEEVIATGLEPNPRNEEAPNHPYLQ